MAETLTARNRMILARRVIGLGLGSRFGTQKAIANRYLITASRVGQLTNRVRWYGDAQEAAAFGHLDLAKRIMRTNWAQEDVRKPRGP